jgi:hypothetical protein
MGNKLEPHGYDTGLRIVKINDIDQFRKHKISEYFDFIVDILEKPIDFKLERDFLKFILLNDN